MRLKLLLVALLFVALLSVLHHVALAESLYWRHPWFDSPMHLIGGFAVGTFIIALLFRFQPVRYVLAMLGVAFGWMAFEWYFGINPHGRNFYFDTANDLFMDAIGATVAYVMARTTLWRSV